MADINNVDRNSGNEIGSLTNDQARESDIPRVTDVDVKANQTHFETEEATEKPRSGTARKSVPKVLTGAGVSPETSQIEAGSQLSSLGGVSATDRLLGLDLRPTMVGVLSPPPGNAEFLRHLSPQARRNIMRKMLNKQRERMRRLARFLRDRRDETSANGSRAAEAESFLEVIGERVEFDRAKMLRATAELEKTARMLNILDEMLAMQDYTISRIGTFTQG